MSNTPVYDAPLGERLFWLAFVALGGARVARAVCERLDERALATDPPCAHSAERTLLLRRRRYGDIPHLDPSLWAPCGVALLPDTPVFELDLCSKAAQAAQDSTRWSTLMAREFASLAPAFAGPEVAVVCRTTLYRQLAMIGFEHRPVPDGLYRMGDSLLRRFYDLVYDKKGLHRVTTKKMDLVVECAAPTLALIQRLERLQSRRA